MKSESIRIGGEAPDFKVAGLRGETLRLKDYRGRLVLLLFYRGHW